MDIGDLCKKYTTLTSSDIEELKKISDILPTISELVMADVFLDCLTKDPSKAVVVAESRLPDGKSNYKNSVVGEIALQKNEPAALRTLNTGISTRGLKAITQENKTVIQTTVPVKNKRNNVIATLIIEQEFKDIKDGEREKIFQFLKSSPGLFEHQVLNLITQHINDCIVIFSKYGKCTYANLCAKRLYKKLGYIDDIVGMQFDNLTFNGVRFEEILNSNDHQFFEINIGGLILEVKYGVMKQGDKISGVSMIIRDVTEVKKKERELILKSVAIKEIHHRVKNNLQTIVSLLNLQSRRINDDFLKRAFNESISRILSIAVTHELLAQEGIDEVNIKSILNKISENALNYIVASDQNIKIDVKGDNFPINSEKATAIALVVNELIQNSIEHGFKDRKFGQIEITIKKEDINSIITVKDNGKGFELGKINRHNLGLSIVEQIVKDKLQGDFTIDTSNKGTKVVFDFKN